MSDAKPYTEAESGMVRAQNNMSIQPNLNVARLCATVDALRARAERAEDTIVGLNDTITREITRTERAEAEMVRFEIQRNEARNEARAEVAAERERRARVAEEAEPDEVQAAPTIDEVYSGMVRAGIIDPEISFEQEHLARQFLGALAAAKEGGGDA